MTQEELKAIREWNDDWDTQRGCRWPVLDLVEEVERLQKELSEAAEIIAGLILEDKRKQAALDSIELKIRNILGR